MRHGGIFLVLLAGLWPPNGRSAPATVPPPTAEQVRFFETRIRPLLADRCYQCHGPKKQKSGLRLDSLEGIRKGGSSGEVVVAAGHPETSLLIKAVGYQGDLKMPPRGKLTERQIEDLCRWVRMGAPYPRDRATKNENSMGRDFWAFQPPADPPVPAVKDATWPQSPLDHFVLAKLEEHGLRPAPAADRRTLIRRATFDLTGLPPTPEEIEDFLADRSPDAFARVVDRLLASPAYGERWGRHWLDVARYADSNGLDENVAHGNAWRYRDYVVAAFNQDRPYDHFLLEQLAGDLLADDDPMPVRSDPIHRVAAGSDPIHRVALKPDPMNRVTTNKEDPMNRVTTSKNERLIATGFLALGPKVLAEVDEKKMEMDIIDEQIDTVGRAVMGLTLGCARCHDHKFDPIPTEDYYALAGIFKSTRTMESFKKIARWYENSLATPQELAARAAHDRQIALCKEAIRKLTQKDAKTAKVAPGQATTVKKPEAPPADQKAELKHLQDELARLEKATPVLPTAMGVTEGTVADVAVHLRGSHLKLGKVVPRHVPRVLAGTRPPAFDGQHSGRLELARWLVRPDHPLTSRVMVNRVWRWHFGQGLVATPDNFGKLGERPANQPLLDWLAHQFADGNWSVKALHRLIMLSSTYRMSSAYDARAALQDPQNRLHWRNDLRRLEAEEVRDSLLAVSGTLDPTMGGSLLQVKNRDYLFDHTSKDTTRYDSRRRSLYLPVIRNHLYDVFGLFDATDATVSNGDRATTTVAPQALFMMNSELVLKASEKLAAGLLGRQDVDDAGRVRLLYVRAYGREPTAEETVKAQTLVKQFEQVLQAKEPGSTRRRLQAWTGLCQATMAANEFVYIR